MTDTLEPETTRSKTRLLPLLAAFALGAIIAAIVLSAMPKPDGTSQAADSSTATQTQNAATGTRGAVDIAATFPSWDPESASLAELVSFVQDVTNPASDNYREPAERIATFDMDGTIICEKAPIYVDYMIMLHRVLDDPTHKSEPQVVSLCEEIREYAMRGEKNSDLSPGRRVAIAHEFAGMTPDEFRAYVTDFLDSEPVVGFDGMTYGETFYKPMLEVIDYLRANDFDVWMVSACEREVVRAAVYERLGIEPDHVLGTDTAFVATGQEDLADDQYTVTQDDELVLSDVLTFPTCAKGGKVTYIQREIGKVPLLSFGNSSGDFAMLNYAQGNDEHRGMGVLVVADDTEREYGNDEKADSMKAEAEAEGWTVFSMRDDWATIYGEGVEKTALVADQELDEAA